MTSADGRIVVFTSAAPALGSPLRPAGYADQVLVRDVVSGANTLVTVAPDGVTPGNEDSFNAGVDATGRRVAFMSIATNLVPGVTGQTVHVYVRDLATGTTTLVDRTTAGAPAGAEGTPRSAGTGPPWCSRPAARTCPARRATATTTSTAPTSSRGIVLVDRSSSGAVANRGADDPDVSADGNRVAFTSTSTNLGGGTSLKDDVYVRDLAAGTTDLGLGPGGRRPRALERARPVHQRRRPPSRVHPGAPRVRLRRDRRG